MSNRSGPQQRWNTKDFAFYGAMLGLIAGMVHSYVHAFWSPPFEGHLITHVLSKLVLFIGGGAAGLAAVSAIRNWLRREP